MRVVDAQAQAGYAAWQASQFVSQEGVQQYAQPTHFPPSEASQSGPSSHVPQQQHQLPPAVPMYVQQQDGSWDIVQDAHNFYVRSASDPLQHAYSAADSLHAYSQYAAQQQHQLLPQYVQALTQTAAQVYSSQETSASHGQHALHNQQQQQHHHHELQEAVHQFAQQQLQQIPEPGQNWVPADPEAPPQQQQVLAYRT